MTKFYTSNGYDNFLITNANTLIGAKEVARGVGKVRFFKELAEMMAKAKKEAKK